jgi:3-phytase
MLNDNTLLNKYLFILIFISNLVIQMCTAQSVSSSLTLQAPGSGDQDDMCIWVHPTDPSQSTVISSDKDVNKLFVYNLDGSVLQTMSVSGKCGNIDVRYNFLLGDQKVDIIGYNDRSTSKIIIYKIDSFTRQLMTAGSFNAGKWPEEIYGFCFYVSPNDGKYYAIACGKSSQMRQWELVDNNDGTIGSIEKRTWKNGTSDKTEGLVADDEMGKLYAANEEEGIYKYDADPIKPKPSGELIAPTGQNGLTDDVEGITLYYASDGAGYIIASSQGSDNIKIYDRRSPHSFVGTFNIQNVNSTDGIDVTNVSLNSLFLQGIFICHNGKKDPCPIEVVKWEDVASVIDGLLIDTIYWNPRKTPTGIDLNKEENIHITKSLRLYQNYPNPFNPTTLIRYDLNQAMHVKLTIFNTIGNTISTLVDHFQPAGSYQINWEAIDSNEQALPNGIYFCYIAAESYVEVIKMLLIY